MAFFKWTRDNTFRGQFHEVLVLVTKIECLEKTIEVFITFLEPEQFRVEILVLAVGTICIAHFFGWCLGTLILLSVVYE